MGFHADHRLLRLLRSSWVLVDVGWERDASRIKGAAESLFGAGSPPAAILLTHDHPDHYGWALELALTRDCPVWMHPEELPITSRDFAAMLATAHPLDPWVVLPLMRAIGFRTHGERSKSPLR